MVNQKDYKAQNEIISIKSRHILVKKNTLIEQRVYAAIKKNTVD